MAESWLEGDVDYEDANHTGGLGKGEYKIGVVGAHPYIGWRAGALYLWATVGYGEGELEITPQDGSNAGTTQSSDVSMRTVGGDGETGGALRYRNPATGITAEGRIRALVGRDDYEEWGIQGSLRLQPGADGQGLSFSLCPGYGDAASVLQQICSQGAGATALLKRWGTAFGGCDNTSPG